MKKIIFASIILAITLSGCTPSQVTPNQPMAPRHYSKNAVADVVKITKIEKVVLDDGRIDGGMFIDTKYIYPDAYKYTIQDNMGISYEIYEIADNQDFSRGECVIRWWDRADNTYPRLSKTGPNCSLLKKEPETAKVGTNQQFTPWLKRKAVLNSWIGYRESDLVRSWGVPTTAYESDGTRFIEYNYKDKQVRTDAYYNVYTNTYTCNTRWEIKNGILVAYKETGNNCY